MRSLPTFNHLRILVIGDCILDRYIQGTTTRISPEAPIPIVDVEHREVSLGGAANVAAGIAALQASVSLIGIVGRDSDGAAFRQLAEAAGISTDGLVDTAATRTVCKTRILADRNQQLLRLDEDGDSEVRRRLADELIPPIIARLEEFDAIVLADYEKGTLPEELLKAAIGCAKASAIPVIVDPKKRDFSAYSDATVVTPNRRELERAVDRPLDSLAEVKRAAEQTRRRFNFDQLLCTCGSDGFVLASADQVIHLPTESVEVADVTGAGDTVVATLAVEIAARRAMDDACRWALMAAAIAVKHSRVHVVTRYELEQTSLRKSSKILPRSLLPAWVANSRRYGHRIVFTNGCFDILHAGHLSYLEQAKERGDVLIVGLNSDESVRRLKGPSRPRVHQDHRAALLAGLACIDCVVIFEEDTPEALLELIRPECLVKGGDYVPSQIVGAKFVREYGGEVIVVRLVQGLSSTAILRE